MVVQIRQLTAADIPAGQRLREQAGWNQTTEDWRRLLTWDPAGCWVAELAGQIVGTTTVTSYGRRIAWVGMVLVDEAYRRQGIGQKLLEHALAYLEARGVQTIALDSTPAGQPLYHRLGFVDQFELARWRGPFPILTSGATSPEAGRTGDRVGSSPEAGIRPLTPADVPAVAAYDARCFGTDRIHILAALQAGHPAGAFLAELSGEVTGYALSRPGAQAWHLGPLTASDARTATALAVATLASAPVTHATIAPAAAPVKPLADTAPPALVMDAITPNPAAVQLARALGLTLVRPFIRMTRGSPLPGVRTAQLYTSAGPELG